MTDRPTKSHEYLFLLSKSPRYYYDADAVREDQSESSIAAYERARANPREPADWKQNEAVAHIGAGPTVSPNAAWSDTEKLDRLLSRGRNLRTVWSIATQPYPGAHFATFPEKLVEPCVKAGTSERGVCPECGAPWRREITKGEPRPVRGEYLGPIEEGAKLDGRAGFHGAGKKGGMVRTTEGWSFLKRDNITTGWGPTCNCYDDPFLEHPTSSDGTPVPATVLDPFAGSGTTGRVAQRLGRRAVLIDLSGDYLVQAMRRNTEIPLGLETA